MGKTLVVKTNNMAIELYCYEKIPEHTSSHTDKMILESLERYCGKKLPQSFKVNRSENGKPYVKSRGLSENLYVGVTHTDKTVIIAVDKRDFGIDCEEISRKITHMESIAKKYFSPTEYKYVFEDDSLSESNFLEIWVKKEAYVKYLGTGILDMKNHDVFNVSGKFERIVRIFGSEKIIIYIYIPDLKVGEEEFIC